MQAAASHLHVHPSLEVLALEVPQVSMNLHGDVEVKVPEAGVSGGLGGRSIRHMSQYRYYHVSWYWYIPCVSTGTYHVSRYRYVPCVTVPVHTMCHGTGTPCVMVPVHTMCHGTGTPCVMVLVQMLLHIQMLLHTSM